MAEDDDRMIDSDSSPQQRDLIRSLAKVIAIAAGLIALAGFLLTDDPGGFVAVGLLVLPLVALAFLPLAMHGTAFRVAAAVVGAALTFAGFVLIIAGIGVLLIPIGALYVAVAVSPGSWSRLRTVTLGAIGGVIVIYGIFALAYYLGDLAGFY